MQLHFLFVGNVAAHLVALMSGVASFLIAIYETAKSRSLAARWFWGIGLLCVFFATDQAWQDEHRNTEAVKSEKSAAVAAANTCSQNAQLEKAYSRGLEGSNRRVQDELDHEQGLISSQQQDISQCVVSLGKMNPKVREEIVVFSIPVTKMDNKGRIVNSFTLIKKYVSVLIVTTNEIEPRFHGRLRCTNAFLPLSAPQLPGTSQTTMVVTAAPHRIDDNEYEISVGASGTEWSPAHPAYMSVSTDDANPGICTFTPIG